VELGGPPGRTAAPAPLPTSSRYRRAEPRPHARRGRRFARRSKRSKALAAARRARVQMGADSGRWRTSSRLEERRALGIRGPGETQELVAEVRHWRRIAGVSRTTLKTVRAGSRLVGTNIDIEDEVRKSLRPGEPYTRSNCRRRAPSFYPGATVRARGRVFGQLGHVVSVLDKSDISTVRSIAICLKLPRRVG